MIAAAAVESSDTIANPGASPTNPEDTIANPGASPANPEDTIPNPEEHICSNPEERLH